MWKKMKENHLRPGECFHLLLMGGDQIYADSIWDEVPIINSLKVKSKLTSKVVEEFSLTPRLRQELTDQLKKFYEQLYIDSWSDSDMSYMMASVPTVMMWDDHDIFDGWGSYPDELQNSDLFRCIYPVANRYFEIFQTRTSSNISRISNTHFSMHFSFRNYEVILLDNRTFRTMKNVMSPSQYYDLGKVLDKALFSEVPEELSKQRTLCFVVPVPIAHLDYSHLVERLLPKVPKKEFRHSMNDDAIDHWDHYNHKAEQKKLLDILFDAGEKHNAKYVCVVSGDVHTAGAATITKTGGKRKITQVISSGTVHSGPNRWEFALMNLVTTPKSDITGYNLYLKNFGNFRKHTINLRNFGILTKAKHSGIVASIEMENRENLAHRTLNKFKN
ncbi:alkaline phosphatase D family protein [Pseudohongiella sp. SYSU M77423]|uniref:alkaline phosphatase D family protein n=1 Tax=Pseudohongiella sp. SYSU M77423 TaxID=3042312 RepID=UPI00247FC8C9|nr:alkaline phosphatase D family protein [Pseudohongiella sp. SYSU M77423]MDH7943457.1 alkaline phosphatase D family protein [Pseudohongiella sp. SYSU M77423]